MQSSAINIDFLQALQAAGAIRQDADPKLMSHSLDIVSHGLISIGDFRQLEELRAYETVMETIADMLDRLLTPDDEGSSESGKAVIRQLPAAAQAQFQTVKSSSDK